MKEAFNTLRSRSLPGAVVFAIALLIGPAMALANWEFTRWGMTVNEVERASHYSAIRTGQGYGCMLQINGPYTFLGVRFSLVKFCFDDETLLESVDLLASVNAYGAVERSEHLDQPAANVMQRPSFIRKRSFSGERKSS
jgi:hypothetical protein